MIIPGMLTSFAEAVANACRHKADPQSLATLTKEIRRLWLNGTVTPVGTPPTGTLVLNEGSTSPHRNHVQSGTSSPDLDNYPPSQRHSSPPSQQSIHTQQSH